MLTTFRFFRTAVLAEPAVAEIEEMGGLMHGRSQIQISDFKSQTSDPNLRSKCQISNFLSETKSYSLLVSGDSIKRTGTDSRLPPRQI